MVNFDLSCPLPRCLMMIKEESGGGATKVVSMFAYQSSGHGFKFLLRQTFVFTDLRLQDSLTCIGYQVIIWPTL